VFGADVVVFGADMVVFGAAAVVFGAATVVFWVDAAVSGLTGVVGALPPSPLPAWLGWGGVLSRAAAVVVVVVVVAVAAGSGAPVKPVADAFACPDGGVREPVAVLSFAPSGARVAALGATSTAVAERVGLVCDVAAVLSGVAWPAISVAAARIGVAAAAVADPAFEGLDGGVGAAAADELAAIAAAAIASGAVELAVSARGASVATGCGPAGSAVATAITVAAGVTGASTRVVLVASVAAVEPAAFLSADLPLLDVDVTDFGPPVAAALPPDFPAAGLAGAGGPE
jgi:hypothetical protein